MKALLYSISALALALTIGAPMLLLGRCIDEELMKQLMLLGTAVWFISWPMATRAPVKPSPSDEPSQ